MTEFTAFILDDDEFILRALQRTLKRLVPHWQLHFFQTSIELLHQLSHCDNVQLVISDRMMPDCLGEDVLRAVQQQKPAAIRCLLTADTSADIVIQDCNFIHHFLAKPFTEADLSRVFLSAEHLNSLPLGQKERQQLGSLSHLPILPALYFELQTLCSASDTTAVQLAKTVAHDPVLAGRLLQLANSPFMGYSRQTHSLDEAIMRLGFDLVQSIAIMLYSQRQLVTSFDEQRHRALLNDTWLRAGLCQRLARDAGLMKELQDKAFMLGLLSGLGDLVIAVSPEIQRWQTYPHLSAAITAYLLTLWGFESALRQALLLHTPHLNAQHEADILQYSLRCSNAMLNCVQDASLSNPVELPPLPDHTPDLLKTAVHQLWGLALRAELPELGVF